MHHIKFLNGTCVCIYEFREAVKKKYTNFTLFSQRTLRRKPLRYLKNLVEKIYENSNSLIALPDEDICIHN